MIRVKSVTPVVLILVVMEGGQGRFRQVVPDGQYEVLILVVMEEGQRQSSKVSVRSFPTES